MSNNKNLHKAKKAKNDEFYTRYVDIENEMVHYKDQLKGLWVYCPCDAEWSNFWKFFVDNFDEYGLRHLTATHIEMDGSQSERLDYDGKEVKRVLLKGNGDFRSAECTRIKNECDIVITNPPFSLFREFFKWLESEEDVVEEGGLW